MLSKIVILILTILLTYPQKIRNETLSATLLTDDRSQITSSNASNVRELGRIGQGTISQLRWLSEQNQLAVISSTGILAYRNHDLDIPPDYLHQENRGVITDFNYTNNEGTFLVQNRNLDVFLSYSNTDRVIDIPYNTEDGTLQDAILSPDGTTLAISRWIGTRSNISFLNTQTGSIISSLHGNYLAANLIFSPDGTKLAAQVNRNEIRVWGLISQNEIFRASSEYFQTFVFSPNGSYLAVGSAGQYFIGAGSVTIWNLETGEQLFTAQPNEGSVNTLAFSPDGTTIVCGSSDNNNIAVLSAQTGEELNTFEWTGEGIGAYSLTFSPDGSFIASFDLEESIHVWETNIWTEINVQQGFNPPRQNIAFNPNDGTLAISNFNRLSGVEVWDTQTMSQVGVINRPNLCCLLFTSEGTLLELPVPASSIAMTPDETTLATAGFTIELWDTDGFTPRGILARENEIINALAFSPNGLILAAVSSTREDGDQSYPNAYRVIRLWDINTNTEIATLGNDLDYTPSIVFSPDGNIIAGGDVNGTITLWDVNTRTITASFTGHSERIESLLFSLDGSVLMSASDDGTIKLWDVASRAEITVLGGHTGQVVDLALSNDGTLLASASWDGTVRLWGLQTDG